MIGPKYIAFAFCKNRKFKFFSPIYRQKKTRLPKICEMIDHELIVECNKILDKSDQQVLRKIDSKKLKAEGCHGQEKKLNPFDLSLCE